MSKREKTKNKIVKLVRISGIAIRTERIANRVVLPDDVPLADLLNELVAEGRLTRRYTLLNNGEVGHLYNLPLTL